MVSQGSLPATRLLNVPRAKQVRLSQALPQIAVISPPAGVKKISILQRLKDTQSVSKQNLNVMLGMEPDQDSHYTDFDEYLQTSCLI